MTRPTRIARGRYWLVTRRTLMRTFMLLPVEWVRALFEYATARASRDTGVQVIGGCCMSSHYHMVVYDPGAELPRFVGLLNELLARAANVEWGRRDHFFESGGPSCVELLTSESVMEALVYALQNPCEARLVRRSRAWAGWQTQPEVLGTTREVARPALGFFTERSTSPTMESLTFHVPATHAALGVEGFRAEVARRLREREDALWAEHGERVLGMDKVLSLHWSGSSMSEEPRGVKAPRGKAGRVEHAQEVHAEHEAELALFVVAHREAFVAMRRGESATFPYGTYRWRVVAGERCADPPAWDRAVRC